MMLKEKVLFIDRDGTLIVEPPEDYQVDSFSKLEFVPGVFRWLSKISEELEYKLVMVTNQDGLGTSSFPFEDFVKPHEFMLKAFENENVVFSDILIDRSFEHEKKNTRKPQLGLLNEYVYGNYDIENSFVIGDRNSDIELAINLGCQGIYFKNKSNKKAVLNTTSWKEIYNFLLGQERKSYIQRQTKETTVHVGLNLDGSGNGKINTGLKFLDHMLDQVRRHALIDLDIDVKGDLEVDEHHTIEDLGLCLGSAFNEALGLKKGIERYGFLLPMDDALAQVAIDFGGRPQLVWLCDFSREYIGDVPTEMFKHFFKSFCDSSKANLNVQASGENEHHKIESIFKAFAKSIKMAKNKNAGFNIPSTKGVL